MVGLRIIFFFKLFTNFLLDAFIHTPTHTGYRSDFMDKYLDMHNSDAVDVHYLTTTVAAEVKKDNS